MDPGRILIPVEERKQPYGEQQRGLMVTFSLTGPFSGKQPDRAAVRRADDYLAGGGASRRGRIHQPNVNRVHIA